MEHLINQIPLDFYALILGGAISGAVGFSIAWYTNKSRDKEWMKFNVYRKLHRQIYELDKNKPLRQSISDFWNTVEPYVLFKMDQTLREKFEKFNTESKKWNKYHISLEKEIRNHEKELVDIFTTAFEKANLLDENKDIILKDHNTTVHQWFQLCNKTIFNPKIKDGKTLYKTMLLEVDPNNNWYKDDLQYFYETNPKLYDYILELRSEAEKTFSSSIDYEGLLGQREKMEKIIEELNKDLERKL